MTEAMAEDVLIRLDRDRRDDLERRWQPVIARLQLLVALSVLAAAVDEARWKVAFGVATLTVAFVGSRLVERRRRRSPDPDRWMLAQQASVSLPIAAFVAVDGGVDSIAAPLLATSAVVAATRFAAWSTPVVLAAFGTVAGLALVAPRPAVVVDEPARVLVWLGSLLAVAAITGVVARSDREARGASALDPLTGLLNRSALAARFAEVAAQARLSDAPVSVLACDLDDFKAINDRHGHDAGDLALVAAAGALRSTLRSFDLAYRLGGDEFLVLLPGADEASARSTAARLRRAVHEASAADCPVTLSTGVATARGEGVEWSDLYGAADRKLYEAKRARATLPGVTPTPRPSPAGSTSAA